MAATTPSTVVPATTPIATTVMAVPAATEAGGKTAPPGSNAKGCGSNTSDWCAAPAGDACGVHKNVAACKADKKCKGMKYTGESLVACKDDGTGFTSNCPTVGCISR